MAMHPDLLAKLANEHQRELRYEADHERLAQQVSGGRPRGVASGCCGVPARPSAPRAAPCICSRTNKPRPVCRTSRRRSLRTN